MTFTDFIHAYEDAAFCETEEARYAGTQEAGRAFSAWLEAYVVDAPVETGDERGHDIDGVATLYWLADGSVAIDECATGRWYSIPSAAWPTAA
jgi:hypothetical protein